MTILKNVLSSTVDNAFEYFKKGGVTLIGIPTGISDLDRLLGGFRNSEYYIVAGRTASGKSSLAFNFATHAAQQGKRVGYITLEMSEQVLGLRYLSAITGMSGNYIERGQFNKAEAARIQEAAAMSENLDIHIYDKTMYALNVEQLLAKFVEDKNPLDILFIDYIGLFADSSENEQERISSISGSLRKYARDFTIPIVTLAQLNRNVEHRESKIPVLSDLRDSGSLEADASAVIMVYRHHYYAMMNGEKPVDKEDDARLIVAKNRHGPVASIDVSFAPKRMLWMDRGKN